MNTVPLSPSAYTESVAHVLQIASSHRSHHHAAPSPTKRHPSLIPFPGRPQRISLLELWHLLSLDAPTVAALWTGFLASVNGIRLPWTSLFAMAVAVWLLYAADRLLDARLLDARLLNTPHAASSSLTPQLEARHRFHHRHRGAFRLGIALASLSLALLLPVLDTQAVRLYLVEGSFLAGYFILIHATPTSFRLPKEIAVGLFFAAATFIPSIARQPALRAPMLVPAILFAALCSLNCLFIYSWEHTEEAVTTAHITTRIALRRLPLLAIAVLVAALCLMMSENEAAWRIAGAIALASAVLLLLHRYRRIIPRTALRAAADLALLTPILFLFA